MLVLGSFPTGRGQSPRNSYSNQTLLKSRSGAVLLLQDIHLHKSAAQQARNIIEKYLCMGMQGYWLSLSSAVLLWVALWTAYVLPIFPVVPC